MNPFHIGASIKWCLGVLLLLLSNGIAFAGPVLGDSDGLDDAWERAYFGHTNYGPLDDPDLDNVTNLDEIAQGTHPLVHNISGHVTQSTWTMQYVDNQDLINSGDGINAFDGDETTFWQTNTSTDPHEIQIDLGQSFTLAGLIYSPSPNVTYNNEGVAQTPEGTVEAYEIYISDDGVTWGEPIATGTFDWGRTYNVDYPVTNFENLREFDPIEARYVRFVALSEVYGNGWVSASEINLLSPAKVFNVTKPEDTADGVCDTDCSLREAILAANARTGFDMVAINSDDVPNIVIALEGRDENDGLTGDFDIADSVIITSTGVAQANISANLLDRLFHIQADIDAYVHLSRLVMSDGRASAPLDRNAGSAFGGGAVWNLGNRLRVTRSSLSNNVALASEKFKSSGYGGAINSRARGLSRPIESTELIIRKSNFNSNCAASGGTIEAVGYLRIIDSRLEDTKSFDGCQSGSAIYLQEGDLQIEHSTINNNTHAVTIYYSRNSYIKSSDISLNSSGIGISYGNLLIEDSTISQNQGAIANFGGQVDIKNTTIAYNSNTKHGIGIYAKNSISLDLNHRQLPYYGLVGLTNTLLVGNSSQAYQGDCYTENDPETENPDLHPPIVSLGGNFVMNSSGCDVAWQPSDIVDQTTTGPILGAYISGLVPGDGHYPLALGSIAIDGGIDDTCTSTDQHGLARPQDGDSNTIATCDIGAIELPRDYVADSDVDQMLDSWEMNYFGDLSRDGSGDFDNDGVTDLQEYLDGTDPTQAPVSRQTAYAQDLSSSGLVVMEAEHASEQVPSTTGVAWYEETQNWYSGRITMRVGDDAAGEVVSLAEATGAARLSYRVNFELAGTYYLWTRGHGTHQGNDEIHVGLNGVPQITVKHLALDGLKWRDVTSSGDVAILEVATPGVHTVDVWMAEDGGSLDKLLLTLDANFWVGPTTGGPEESTQMEAEDTDADQMLDGWEMNYFGDLSRDGSGDFDNDGVTDLQEYLDGTDPTQAPVSGQMAYVQDLSSSGLVVMEAEHADEQVPSSTGVAWYEETQNWYSGRITMRVGDDAAGEVVGLAEATGAARLSYRVNFKLTGTYYLWTRGQGTHKGNDEIHFGLDGEPQITVKHLARDALKWRDVTSSGDVAILNVATPGVHTVDVWMAEDGGSLDKLLLTQNAYFGVGPTTGGPEESTRMNQ